MLNVADCCRLYRPIYDGGGEWDHLFPIDGSYAAVKRVDGIDYVIFRGSTTPLDWLEDFSALMIDDHQLGPVHGGFRGGVLAVMYQIDHVIGPDVVVLGHSLGAAHAILYGGYLAARGRPAKQIVVWGEPRAGGPKLKSILASTPILSYRNGDAESHDPVTDVPIFIPVLEDYCHPRPLIDVCAPPPRDDSWGPVAWHHFELYCQACGAV